MKSENLTQLIQAIASLLQAIIWPSVALFVIIYFGKQIKQLLDNVSELTLKAGPSGFEATIKRKIEAAAMLGAASAQKKPSQEPSENERSAEEQSRKIAEVVDRAANPKTSQELPTKWVLWVDDRLEENVYEKKSLEALGIHFTLCQSTQEALETMKARPYHAAISDMERPPDDRAGYTLLERMRRSGYYIPYILYDRTILPEHDREARELGANGSTNNPQELFEMVISCLVGEVLVK